MKRNFNEWLSTMKDCIASWNYYSDLEKAYRNVESIKVELNILNSLIGSKNIEKEFVSILNDYPKTLKVIPILLAKREKEMKIVDVNGEHLFNFKNPNYSIDEYVSFMRKTGLFDLLENHIINNLFDYVTGVEVGLDSNGRKNRGGDAMEDLVEAYLVKYGLVKGKTYFKEMKDKDVEKNFNLDLGKLSNRGKANKRFDFVIYVNNHVYVCECNFYTSSGSKLNETARSYKTLATEAKEIEGLTFVWFTDGTGWNTAKNNLEETFDVLDTMYNIKDLDDGILDELLNSVKV